jgi:lipopolysaccharide heptosyltransferase I
MRTLAEQISSLEAPRICVIKPSSLGDIIHALPILPALRQLFPRCRITWIVMRPFASLLEEHPQVDEVIAYERGGSGITSRGIVGVARLCRQLLSSHYDLAVDLQGLLRSGLMTGATRAPIRVGLEDAREGARSFYTHRVDASRMRMHAVDRIVKIAQAMGLERLVPSFHIPLTDRDTAWARAKLAGVPGPRLVLNLGARWLTKRWPPEHFAEVARRASTEFGAGLIAVGTQEDRALVESLRQPLGSIPLLDLSGQTTLLQLAAVARESDLFVSNDTGPLHLAAAAGTSVLGIYTCTDPHLTGPYGSDAHFIQSCVWCAPSFRKSCPRLECLSELSPDRVWPIVRDRLARSLESAA